MDYAKIAFICRILGLANNLFAIFYAELVLSFENATDPRILHYPAYKPYFFTAWNLIVQTLYLLLALCHDRVRSKGSEKLERSLGKIRGYVFFAFATPTTLVTSFIFWLLYFVDRNLIYPPSLDGIVPTWLNFITHTSIAFIWLAEALLEKLQKPRLANAIYGASLLTIVYAIDLIVVYLTDGVWVYVGMNVMPLWKIPLGFLAITVSAIISCIVGMAISIPGPQRLVKKHN